MTIDAYIYRFKLSVAKIQIMTLDVNRTSYNTQKEKSENKEMSKAAKLNLQSVKKMQERLAGKKETEFEHIKMSEFLNFKTEE